MVITDAVKGLTEKRVGKGRVLGMIYLTACALKEGQSLGEATAENGTIDFVKVEVSCDSIAPGARSCGSWFKNGK